MLNCSEQHLVEEARTLKGGGAGAFNVSPKGGSFHQSSASTANSVTSGSTQPRSHKTFDLSKLLSEEVRNCTPLASRRPPHRQTQIVFVPTNLDAWTMSRTQSCGEQGTGPLRAASSPGLLRSDAKMRPPAAVSCQAHFTPANERDTNQQEKQGVTAQARKVNESTRSWKLEAARKVEQRKVNGINWTSEEDADAPKASNCRSAGPHHRDSFQAALAKDSGEHSVTLKDYFNAVENVGGGRRASFSWDMVPTTSLSFDEQPSPSNQGSENSGPTANPAAGVNPVAEQKKEAVRQALIKGAGGALEAFRTIDLNRNNAVSSTELLDGLNRLGVNWQEITGFSKYQELFRLFDCDRDSKLTLNELFPAAHLYLQSEVTRMSTPDFWIQWCKKMNTLERVQSPRWVPSTPDEELFVMRQAADQRQEVANARRRMIATIRRLKSQGMSDARCREFVAPHLPRGTGPKERDNIHTFSEAEVHRCRRAYLDPIHTHARSIQQNVHDMREQRQVLKGYRHQLWMTMNEQAVRKKKGEDN